MIKNNVNRFAWKYTPTPNPSTSPVPSVVPGTSDAEGAWTSIASTSDIAHDVYMIWILVCNGNTAGQAKNHLLDIGVDQAGGTSYTAVISNIICGQSANNVDGGIHFAFPLYIKAGSSVAVRIQGSNATAGTVRVQAIFFGKPTHPEFVSVGQFSETIGTITGSLGVSFTPGNSSAEGTWVSLGTTTKMMWYWQLAVQIDNATTTTTSYHMDLAWGDGTNMHMLVENMRVVMTGNSEKTHYVAYMPGQNYGEVPAGATLYVRGTCSGTAETGWNAVAIGIGG